MLLQHILKQTGLGIWRKKNIYVCIYIYINKYSHICLTTGCLCPAFYKKLRQNKQLGIFRAQLLNCFLTAVTNCWALGISIKKLRKYRVTGHHLTLYAIYTSMHVIRGRSCWAFWLFFYENTFCHAHRCMHTFINSLKIYLNI